MRPDWGLPRQRLLWRYQETEGRTAEDVGNAESAPERPDIPEQVSFRICIISVAIYAPSEAYEDSTRASSATRDKMV